jgi:hypothetical protein
MELFDRSVEVHVTRGSTINGTMRTFRQYPPSFFQRITSPPSKAA